MFFHQKKSLLSILFGIFASASAVSHAQQVALLDSGVDSDAGFNLAPGFNYILNTQDTSDVSVREGETHGNVSARLITESFSGQIVPFVIVDSDGSQLTSELTAARDSAFSDILGRDQVRVVSISRGVAGITGSAAPLLPQLSESNKVIAIMAGNGGQAQPNALSTSSFNLSGVIVVGASDSNGNLLSVSNRAGTTADKYVVANGLPSDGSSNGGTSWATARISGIAGAVFQQNPNLTAEQVVDVILQSAEDRGAQGTDTEFGRGFIRNAEQVLSNVIGPVVVPGNENGGDSGGGGSSGGGVAAALLIGGAVAGAVLYSRSRSKKLEKTLVLDSYGRGFQVDLNKHIRVNDGAFYLNGFLNAFEQQSINESLFIPSLKTQVSFSGVSRSRSPFDSIEYFNEFRDVALGDAVLDDNQADVSFSLQSELSSQVQFFAGYQVDADQVYGAVSQIGSTSLFGQSSFLSGNSFGSPLSGFSQQAADTFNFQYRPRNTQLSFSAGFVSIDEGNKFGLNSGSSILQAGYQFNQRAGVNLQLGQLDERGSVLGGASEGVFSVDSSNTYAVNFSGHLKLSDKMTLLANYGIGKTSIQSAQNSLLKDYSSLKSNWYSLGLIGNNLWRGKDQFGISYSQPLKITSGSVDFSIPTHYRANGLIHFDTQRVDLSETDASEINVETYYRTMLSKHLELGAYLTYRQNPNHVRANGNNVIFMSTLKVH